MKVFRYLFLLLIIFICSGYAVFYFSKTDPGIDPETTVVFENDAEVVVEIADTPAERMQGLSGKEFLDKGAGMWFEFEEPERLSFWMRDMHFPIDIVWILDNRVVGIEEHVSPESFPERFHPPSPANRVLEVPAGDAKRLGITVGQTVTPLK